MCSWQHSLQFASSKPPSNTILPRQWKCHLHLFCELDTFNGCQVKLKQRKSYKYLFLWSIIWLLDRFLWAMYNTKGLRSLEKWHALLIYLLGKPQEDVEVMVHLDLKEVASCVEKWERVEIPQFCAHCGGLGAKGMSMRYKGCEKKYCILTFRHSFCLKVVSNKMQKASDIRHFSSNIEAWIINLQISTDSRGFRLSTYQTCCSYHLSRNNE